MKHKRKKFFRLLKKEKQMTKFNIPDDSVLVAEVGEYPILADGVYTVEITKVAMTQIKNGSNNGAPALNLELRTSKNRVFYKLIPLWAAGEAANERTWLRMSRVAFVTVLGITNEVLFNEPESLINKVLDVQIGHKPNAKGVVENFVVTFK